MYVIIIAIEDEVMAVLQEICKANGIPLPECILGILFGGGECESGEVDRVPEGVFGA